MAVDNLAGPVGPPLPQVNPLSGAGALSGMASQQIGQNVAQGTLNNQREAMELQAAHDKYIADQQDSLARFGMGLTDTLNNRILDIGDDHWWANMDEQQRLNDYAMWANTAQLGMQIYDHTTQTANAFMAMNEAAKSSAEGMKTLQNLLNGDRQTASAWQQHRDSVDASLKQMRDNLEGSLTVGGLVQTAGSYLNGTIGWDTLMKDPRSVPTNEFLQEGKRSPEQLAMIYKQLDTIDQVVKQRVDQLYPTSQDKEKLSRSFKQMVEYEKGGGQYALLYDREGAESYSSPDSVIPSDLYKALKLQRQAEKWKTAINMKALSKDENVKKPFSLAMAIVNGNHPNDLISQRVKISTKPDGTLDPDQYQAVLKTQAKDYYPGGPSGKYLGLSMDELGPAYKKYLDLSFGGEGMGMSLPQFIDSFYADMRENFQR